MMSNDALHNSFELAKSKFPPLPVLFLMLSNHYPLSFSTEYNWIIASVVFLMGVSIRHYFNTIHARKGNPIWTWFVTLGLFIIIIILSIYPALKGTINDREEVSLSEVKCVTQRSLITME